MVCLSMLWMVEKQFPLRGYPNQSLSSQDGSTIYNRFSLELRYPITLKPAASIFGLTFMETGQGYNNFREFNPFNGKRSVGLGLEFLCLLLDF